MAKPQKSTAQSEVPGLVKKGPLYYLKRDWQLYALMLLPMVFIIVFKYFAYTGLSVAFLDSGNEQQLFAAVVVRGYRNL